MAKKESQTETEETKVETEETQTDTGASDNHIPDTQIEVIQARVLGGFTLDDVQYEPNDVIEGTPSLIKSLASSVDADPEAVKYCLGLAKPVIKRHAL